MHGQRLPTYQVTRATDLVLFSTVDEPWFRARVDPEVKIWTVGHPRLEKVRKEVGVSAFDRGRKPRITFFSQPIEGDYSREIRLNDWRIFHGLKEKAEVRFRAHPRENLALIRDDLAIAGIAFVEVSEAGLTEDLRWCDAVASSWSTVSMEAAACGRGIFWTCSTPERYEASCELRDHGIGLLVQTTDQWPEILESWHSGKWQEPVIVPDSRLTELGMIGDLEKSWIERLKV